MEAEQEETALEISPIFSGALLVFQPDQLMVLRHGFGPDMVQRFPYEKIMLVSEGRLQHWLTLVCGLLLFGLGAYLIIDSFSTAGILLAFFGMVISVCAVTLYRQVFTIHMEGWKVRFTPCLMSESRRKELVQSILDRVAANQAEPPTLYTEQQDAAENSPPIVTQEQGDVDDSLLVR